MTEYDRHGDIITILEQAPSSAQREEFRDLVRKDPRFSRVLALARTPKMIKLVLLVALVASCTSESQADMNHELVSCTIPDLPGSIMGADQCETACDDVSYNVTMGPSQCNSAAYAAYLAKSGAPSHTCSSFAPVTGGGARGCCELVEKSNDDRVSSKFAFEFFECDP